MTPDLEALARRAVACPRWRWMPGMRWVTPDDDAGRCDDWQPEGMARPAGALPDLTDPATLGCLLEIYDQTRKRRICPDVVYTFAAVYGLTHQKTIEALVAALEAAP